MDSAVASQQEGPGFDPRVGRPGKFLCGVCMFSSCLSGFPTGTPVSSTQSKHMHVRLIGHSKLPVRVCVSVCVHAHAFVSVCS